MKISKVLLKGSLVLTLGALALVNSQTAEASSTLKSRYSDFYLDNVEVVESEESEIDALGLLQPGCQEAFELDAQTNFVMAADDGGFSISDLKDFGVVVDEVINLGTKIWTLIEKNKPVVSAKSAMASATPQGIRCWQTLENWSAPTSVTYRYTYKNLYRMTVVDFEFKVIYTYGGQLLGTGRYLTNVQVVPTHLDVAWGYTFNAVAKIQQPVNLGTKANPVAGLESQINWTIDTVVKHGETTVPVFVDGLGNAKTL
jgi:hypothetical protein